MAVTVYSEDDLALDGLPITLLAPSRSRPPPISASQETSQRPPRLRRPRRERKPACTECRQQKLKCDYHLNSNKPCSRCRKFDLTCFQSLDFQRVEVRKTQKPKDTCDEDSDIIQLETQQQLQTTTDNSHMPMPMPSHNTYSESPNFLLPTDTVSNFTQSDLILPFPVPTRSRTLSNIHVSERVIDECFDIFTSHYSPLLSIFTAPLIPNDCYHQSLTLFWAIIAIGSRSLVSDPTLLQGLAPEVLNLCLTSVQLRRNHLDDIKGLLLLCTWPFPTGTSSRDNLIALNGLLLSLSMEAGLYLPTSAGTGKVPHRQVEMASLWAQVIITWQSAMIYSGYPSEVPFTGVASNSFEMTSWHFLPNHLKLRYKTHALLFDFESVKYQSRLDGGSISDQIVLSSRTNAAKAQLDNLYVEFCSITSTPYDELYVQIARLMLDVLQLYSNTEAGNQIELIQLFTTASNLVVVVNTLDHTTNITSYAPNYLLKSICLAAFMLLRLVKSYFGPILDADVKEEGKSALFVAINLLKQMSLVNNDICAKAADSLSAMWTDQIVFKVTDLSSWGKLRIRNELSISVVFDSILAWVETYGCNDVVSAQLRTQSDRAEFSTGPTNTLDSTIERAVGEHPSSRVDNRCHHELDSKSSLDCSITEPTWGFTCPWKQIRRRYR